MSLFSKNENPADGYIIQEERVGQPMTSQGYTPQSMIMGDRPDLLEKIKPDLLVELLMHRLMGEELIASSWVKNSLLTDRALSFIGAWDIANLMLGVSSQNTALSNLKDAEIKARVISLTKTAQKMALRNWKIYGIRGRDQLYFINELIFSVAFITLKQSENEGIRDLIRGTSKWSLSDNPNMNKGGVISSLFRR